MDSNKRITFSNGKALWLPRKAVSGQIWGKLLDELQKQVAYRAKQEERGRRE